MQERIILALLFAPFTLSAAPIDWVFQTPVITIQPDQNTVIYDTLPVSPWAANSFDLMAVEEIPAPDALNFFWLLSETVNVLPGNFCLCVNMGDDAIQPPGTEMWTTSYLSTGAVYELVISAAPGTQFELNPQLFGYDPIDPSQIPTTVPEPNSLIAGAAILLGVVAARKKGKKGKKGSKAPAIIQG